TGSREENASKQKAGAPTLIPSKPEGLDGDWRERAQKSRRPRERASAKFNSGEFRQLAAASFFVSARFSSSAFGDSSASLAFARNASRPQRWSTDFSALAEIRKRTERLSASEVSVTLTRFGRNRRLV